MRWMLYPERVGDVPHPIERFVGFFGRRDPVESG
jgi:hypothetical protein